MSFRKYFDHDITREMFRNNLSFYYDVLNKGFDIKLFKRVFEKRGCCSTHVVGFIAFGRAMGEETVIGLLLEWIPNFRAQFWWFVMYKKVMGCLSSKQEISKETTPYIKKEQCKLRCIAGVEAKGIEFNAKFGVVHLGDKLIETRVETFHVFMTDSCYNKGMNNKRITREELDELAKTNGVKYYRSLSKLELAEMLGVDYLRDQNQNHVSGSTNAQFKWMIRTFRV